MVKKLLALAVISASFIVLGFLLGHVYAATPTPTPTPAPTGIQPLQSQETNINNLGDLFGLLRNFLFTVIGVFTAGIILYGGFLYMTSRGEPEQIKKAQAILLYAFIGIAVIALSVIIVHVVAAILGINVGNIL